MALSGSFNTSSYSGRYLTLSWTATQSIADNKSTISWTLKGAGEASAAWYMAGSFKVVIEGETVFNSATRIQLYNGTVVASGTKVITHNTNGSKSFSASAQAAIYSASVNCSGNGSWALNAIPRAASITSAPNFNDEANPVIQYTNPAGTNVTSLAVGISLDGSKADIAYREVSKTGTSYTFSLTDAERKILRKATTGSNSRKVGFYIRTVVSGNTFYNSAWRDFSIINYSPTLNPTVEDINPDTALYTQNPTGIVIKGYSTMQVATGAAAVKEATIVSQSITCGKKVINAASGTMDKVESATFVFSVTDNRGNTTTKTITNTLINYITPTCNISATNITTAGETTITISGNCYRGSLGAIENSVGVTYAVGLTTETDTIQSTSIKPIFSGNTYKATIKVSGLDYKKAYKISADVIDLLETVFAPTKTIRSIPLFDWTEDEFAFHTSKVIFDNGLILKGVDTEGYTVNNLELCNAHNNCTLGYGGYSSGAGNTNIYGDSITLTANNGVTINGNAIDDIVISTGTASMGSNGTWYWRKWKSGRAECYGCRNYGNMGVSTAWGNLYRSDIFNQSLPSGLFTAAPETIEIRVRNTDNGAWVVNQGTAPTTTTTGTFSVIRPVSGTLSAVHISFNIIGRWK